MEYGQQTLDLIQDARGRGAEHIAVVMRHSARTYKPGIRDFDNPLTDEGRALAQSFGEALAKDAHVRAYSSPVGRCVDTAEKIIVGHEQSGGTAKGRRDIEVLGNVHILDFARFAKAVQEVGLDAMYPKWFAGELAPDLLLPSKMLSELIAHVVLEKLDRPIGGPQIDVLVSHDMNLYPMRHHLLNQTIEEYGRVNYLDGLVFYAVDGVVQVQSHHGQPEPLKLG
ncbi:MAG: histidine phosphatase family protein [Pseudomonadota bacterium]